MNCLARLLFAARALKALVRKANAARVFHATSPSGPRAFSTDRR